MSKPRTNFEPPVNLRLLVCERFIGQKAKCRLNGGDGGAKKAAVVLPPTGIASEL